MQENNQNKNNKQKSRNYLFILIIICAIAIMLVVSNLGGSVEKIEINDLITKIKNDEIAAIYTQNGNEIGKVLLKVADTDENEANLKKFPSKKSDYWFVVNNNVLTLLNKYFEDDTYDFEWRVDKSPVNWTSFIMPALYVIILLVSLYLIFKMFSRTSGKGFMGMGKNKIRSEQKSKVKFSDVAGIKEEKEELVEIVDYLKNPKKYVQMGARIPKGVLLVGEPGTGKTLLAKAIAGESGVPFYSISGSDFVEMYVGVGASRVRELFEEAKKNLPCIVFIDEIDAVGRMRGVGLGGGNDEREQTLNQLLVEMDGFEMNEGLIVMAATNRVDILDPALTRPGRFDRRIHVYPPDVKGRQEILEVYAKNKPLAIDVDLRRLARVTGGFTGADIENLLNEAALNAAKNNKPYIDMEDILDCVNKVRLGLAKTSREVTEKTKLRTAYHESGHAILCKVLDCGDLQEVSITPRGFAGGYTAHVDKDESALYTRQQLNDLIAQAMGGRIAEFLQFTDVSVGAENDIRQASEIARRMVTDWGMSEKLGFIAYNNENDMFERRRTGKSIQFSESITSEIDNEVRNIINANYARALNILQEHKHHLDEMAKLLMERETIYAYEVDEIMSGKSVQEILSEIEKIENERKRNQTIKALAKRLKDVTVQKDNKTNGVKFMVNANALSEAQIEECYSAINNAYENEIADIKAKAEEAGVDYVEIFNVAFNPDVKLQESDSIIKLESNTENIADEKVGTTDNNANEEQPAEEDVNVEDNTTENKDDENK